MVSPCNNLVVTVYQIHHLAPRHVDSLRLRAPLMSPVIIVCGGAPCQPPAAVVLLLLLLSLSLCRRITLPVPVSSGDHRCVVVSHSASHSITARSQVSFVFVDIALTLSQRRKIFRRSDQVASLLLTDCTEDICTMNVTLPGWYEGSAGV